MEEFSPLVAGAWRYLIAATVILPMAWREPAGLGRLREFVGPLVIMVLCGGVAYQWLFLLALRDTTATNASLLIAVNPVMTVILATFLGERLDRSRLAGVCLALAGAAILITRGEAAAFGELATGRWRSGDLLCLLAAFCWATFNVSSRHVVGNVSSPVVNLLVYGGGGLMLALLAGPGPMLAEPRGASPAAMAAVAIMGVFASALSGMIFLYGVRVVGVGRTVVFVYLTPVLTAVASVLWLGEDLLPAHLVGGGAVLLGVWASTRRVD